VIWHKNAKPWTKAEKARLERMRVEIGCIVTWLEDGVRRPMECTHHIISGNKRMGHMFTLPLTEANHARMHDGTFSHAEQIEMWLKVQHALGLSDELPVSKVVPRRVA
jgi:hypothetical protein